MLLVLDETYLRGMQMIPQLCCHRLIKENSSDLQKVGKKLCIRFSIFHANNQIKVNTDEYYLLLKTHRQNELKIEIPYS